MQTMERKAARFIVLNLQGAVLLFQYNGADDKRFWATPGGGLEDGETYEQAARREAREELSLTDIVLHPLWERVTQFLHGTRMVLQQERYFLLQIKAWQPAPEIRQAHDAEGILQAKWWSLADIAVASEAVFPEDLIQRLQSVPGLPISTWPDRA